jgi:hypothetical protein
MSDCPNPLCGAPDPLDSDFCPQCGEYLRFDELTGERPVVRRSTPVAAPPPPPAPPVPSAPAAPAVDPVKLHLRLPGTEESDTEPPAVGVEPGGAAALHAHVRNQGPVTAAFAARVDGIPRGWWSVPTAPLRLNPLDARAADADGEIEIAFHPPREPASEAREWPLAIVVESSAGHAAHAAATLVIGRYADALVSARPEVRSARRRAVYELTVENRGNTEVDVELSGAEAEDACRIEMRPAQVRVAPGEQAGARLTARPRKTRWFGRVTERQIALTAGPASAHALVVPPSLRLRHRAWLPWWVPPVAALAVAAVAAVFLLVPHSVQVPDVRGAASPFEAQRLLQPAGLAVAPRYETRKSDRLPPGTVVDQSPDPGDRVRRGSPVTLVVASGNGQVTVPDLAHKTLQEADAALADAGLKLGGVTPGIDYDRPIAGQIPAAGEQRPTGTPVAVTLGHLGHGKPSPSAVPSPSATPSAAPGGGEALVYDDAENLQMLGPGASKPEALTDDGASTEPAAAPDGQMIAYRRDVGGSGQIYLLDLQRGAPGRALTEGGGDFGRPAFVPGTDMIAYVRREDYALCIARIGDPPSSARCTTDRDWAFNRPTVSPEGDAILVLAFRRSDPAEAGLFEFTRDGDGPDAFKPADDGLVMRVAHPQFVAWGPRAVAVMSGPASEAAQLTLVPVAAGSLQVGEAQSRAVFGCEVAWRADGALAIANHACSTQVANGPIVVLPPDSETGDEVGVQGGNPVWIHQEQR